MFVVQNNFSMNILIQKFIKKRSVLRFGGSPAIKPFIRSCFAATLGYNNYYNAKQLRRQH
jgi:hypothetical protein